MKSRFSESIFIFIIKNRNILKRIISYIINISDSMVEYLPTKQDNWVRFPAYVLTCFDL